MENSGKLAAWLVGWNWISRTDLRQRTLAADGVHRRTGCLLSSLPRERQESRMVQRHRESSTDHRFTEGRSCRRSRSGVTNAHRKPSRTGVANFPGSTTAPAMAPNCSPERLATRSLSPPTRPIISITKSRNFADPLVHCRGQFVEALSIRGFTRRIAH